jgi:hypothetical protein
VISLFVDFFLGDLSPIRKYGSAKRQSMGSTHMKPAWDALLSCVMVLGKDTGVRAQCADALVVPCMVATARPVWCTQTGVPLSPQDASILKTNCTFFAAVLKSGLLCAEVAALLADFSKDDVEFSTAVCTMLTQGIEQGRARRLLRVRCGAALTLWCIRVSSCSVLRWRQAVLDVCEGGSWCHG